MTPPPCAPHLDVEAAGLAGHAVSQDRRMRSRASGRPSHQGSPEMAPDQIGPLDADQPERRAVRLDEASLQIEQADEGEEVVEHAPQPLLRGAHLARSRVERLGDARDLDHAGGARLLGGALTQAPREAVDGLDGRDEPAPQIQASAAPASVSSPPPAASVSRARCVDASAAATGSVTAVRQPATGAVA